MPINNYLITMTNPAPNEMGVPIERIMTVTFQKNMMASTLTASTIKLRKVNGDLIPTKLSYDNVKKILSIEPASTLEPTTQYQLEIVGGLNGIQSVIEETMGNSRFYEFYTVEQEIAAPVASVKAEAVNGFINASWEAISIIGSYEYEVKLSRSSSPLNASLWPDQGPYVSSSLSINIPKKLEAGTYYVHVRTKKGELRSEWTTQSVAVKEEPVEQGTPEGSPGGSSGDLDLYLKVIETFPKDKAFNVLPEKVGVLFSEELDLTKYSDWLRVEEVTGQEMASFMGVSASVVSGVIEQVRDGMSTSKVLTFVPDVPFEKDKEYRIVVKDAMTLPSEDKTMEVEGSLVIISGEAKKLKTEHIVSFRSKFTHFYITVPEVKAELQYFGQFVDEDVLAMLIASNSRAAYEIASGLKNFDASLFTETSYPFYMHEYVKYKTSYDVAISSMVELSMGTDKTIQLADMSVGERGRQSFVLQSLINELKAKIKPWEDLMHGKTARGYASMGSAIYAETGSPYPDFFEGRAEYPELGK